MNIYNSALPQLVGVAGTFASGKDTIAEFLEKDYGFTHVSTSDMVREIAMSRRGSIERPILREVANEERSKHGSGVFVELALSKPRPLAITAIRSLGEAQAVKDNGGVMIFVDAPAEVRYKRMKTRQRDGEFVVSFDDFIEREQKELHGDKAGNSQDLLGVRAISDIIIENTGSLEDYMTAVYQKLGISKS